MDFVLELRSVEVCAKHRSFCVTVGVITFQWIGGQTGLGNSCECLGPLSPARDRILLDKESKESKMPVPCWSPENRESFPPSDSGSGVESITVCRRAPEYRRGKQGGEGVGDCAPREGGRRGPPFLLRLGLIALNAWEDILGLPQVAFHLLRSPH